MNRNQKIKYYYRNKEVIKEQIKMNGYAKLISIYVN